MPRQITNEKHITTVILKAIQDNVPLPAIYSSVESSFKSKNSFYIFFENKIMHILNDDDAKNYFIGYFTYCFNHYTFSNVNYENMWSNASMVYNKKALYPVMNKAARQAWDIIINNYLYIPAVALKDIDECFSANEPITTEINIHSKNYNRLDFLNYYLLHNKTSLQLNNYIENIFNSLKSKYNNISTAFIVRYITQTKRPIPAPWSVELFKSVFNIVAPFTYKNESLDNLLNYCKSDSADESVCNYVTEIRWSDYVNHISVWKSHDIGKIDAELARANDIFLKDRQFFSKKNILLKLYGATQTQSERYSATFFDDVPENQYINEQIQYYYTAQPNQLIENNYISMQIGAPLWRLFYKTSYSTNSISLVFEGLPDLITSELQRIYRNIFQQSSSILKNYLVSLNAINRICTNFHIGSLRQVTDTMAMYTIQAYRSEGYKANTLRKIVYSLKGVFNELNKLPEYISDPHSNPLEHIQITNAAKNTEHTPSIPKEVRAQIEEHINELEIVYRVLYHALYELAGRFNMIFTISIRDLVYDPKDNEEYAKIYFHERKTHRARVSKDVNEVSFDYISVELYQEIQEYIKSTQDIREKFGTDKVFVNTNQKGQLCDISTRTFSNKMNDFIQKHDITTLDGKLWKYHSKQARKTAASDLISEGASLIMVQNKLKHLRPTTTEVYYAEVNKETILKKNTEFFKQKFTFFASEDILSRYTESERSVLYADFLLNYREVELGMCCKHISEGTCTKYGHIICATCPYLVTSEKYLPKWKRLYDNAKNRVDELKQIYIKHNIPEEEYTSYREYSIENQLMESYKAVLAAIEKEL